jgi:tRNA G18 (ribose-2'-O)-methylase SpoU
MPCIEISSIDDLRIAPFRQLKESNATRRAGLFICEGAKLTRRLIDSDYEVVSLLVGRSWAAEYADLARQSPIYVTPDEWIEQIIGFNFHRGVLACGRRRPPLTVASLCQQLSTRALLVICPDVQDPENLGAILRIASAFAVDGIVLGDKTADPLSRRVLRVSMGASLRIPIGVSANLLKDLSFLAEQERFERWATVLDSHATPLGQLRRPDRLALLFGSEGHGLDRDLVAACDRRATIPMAEGVDSLNVAVATGIFLYELGAHCR